MGYFGKTWNSPFFVLWPLGQKMGIFKYHQNTPCGYSKLVPEDAWQDAKGFRSIWSFHPEKTSKMAQNGQFSPHFGHFLRIEWSTSCQTSNRTSLEYHMRYFGNSWKSPFFALEAIGQKMAIVKSHQNTPCGYSKLVPKDVWQDAKGFRALWSFNPEKTFQNVVKIGDFGRFLRMEWSDWPESICILSGIFWYKFRVTTWGILVKLENCHFLSYGL